MKIKGTVIVTPLMSQMKVGEKGFLTTEAVVIINNDELLINTGNSVSEVTTEKHKIPIERIGPGKEDFEIDFNIAMYFYNNICNEEEKKSFKTNDNIIGPFQVQTEIYRYCMYKEQIYPRLDENELLEELIKNNRALLFSPDSEIAGENKKALEKLMKKKLKEMPLEDLKEYISVFSPLSEEENEEGTLINYTENERLLFFVQERIKTLKAQKKIEEMSIKELQTELILANQSEDFERSVYIRDVINNKK